MEIHIQKCQRCGSRRMRNILVRDEEQKVFVQCRDCDSLVARYILTVGGYYHAGKDFESFLRSMERDGESSSGRDIQSLFEEVKNDTEQEFSQLDEQLIARYGDKLP